jgi:4-diphosphocytidyl-2-C-methyl-D-erythritol kinase
VPSVTRRAPAKVNLALSVGAAEPSGAKAGWHRIASWMVCLDLADTVTVKPAEGTSHRVVWASDAVKPSPIDWPIERDLAVRAHRALEAKLGRELLCEMVVEKRIPVGGGLGGGSSDAASALLALREAFGLAVSDDELAAIGARLGSDVPFFVDPDHRPALVTGFGETIERTPAVRGELLLLVPPFGCGTPEVYRAFDAIKGSGGPEEARVREMARAGLEPSAWFNDLESAAFRVEPRLAQIRDRASEVLGTRVMMTGSGSTLLAWQPTAARIGTLQERVLADRESEGPLAGCVALSTRFV